jgi:hypothetical protein
MKEEWTRWEPIKGISGQFYLDSLAFSEEGLSIELSNKLNFKKIQIKFNNPIDTYRYTDESVCFGIFGDLSKKYGNDFYSTWSFFKINNSEYLQWLSEVSGKSINSLPFIHFFIKSSDEIIDILSPHEPEVKIIE